MGRVKKPVWFDGKIYDSTTELAKATNLSLRFIYKCLALDKPVKRNGRDVYIDYAITNEEMFEYCRNPAFRKIAV